MDMYPGGDNLIIAEFDHGLRYENFMSELEQLPPEEQGFFGTHLKIDPRTGGIMRDAAGSPIRVNEPADNPFDGKPEHISG